MMNRVVYKYPLHAPVVEVQVPELASVRLVGLDPVSGNPALWLEHDLDNKRETRTFIVMPTGHHVENGADHVGSVIAGHFVWHVYERLLRPAAG